MRELLGNKDVIKKIYSTTLALYFLLLILGAITIGSFGSALRIFGFLPIIVWIFEYKLKIKRNKLWKDVFIYFLIVGLSCIWSINDNNTFSYTISVFSFLLLLVASSIYSFSHSEINMLRNALIWSSRLTAIITLAFSKLYQGRMYLNGVINEDPNYLCAYFIFGAVNSICCILSTVPFKKKTINIIELLVYAFIIISTGSRGGLLAVSVAVFIGAYLTLREKKVSITTILSRMLIIVVFVVALFILINSISHDILARYTLANILSNGGTGRIDIWKDVLRVFNDASLFRKIFGFGASTSLDVASTMNFSIINVTHNAFLENLLGVGLIGLFFYTLYILRFAFYAWKIKNTFAFAAMIGFVCMSLSTSIGAFKPYWNIMIFIICLSSESD